MNTFPPFFKELSMKDLLWILMLVLVASLVSGCASSPDTGVNTIVKQVDNNGKVLSITETLTDSARMDIAIEQTKQECYQRLEAKDNLESARLSQVSGIESDARIISLAAINRLADINEIQITGQRVVDCPGGPSSRDVQIVKTKERHQTGRQALGMIPGALRTIVGGRVISDAVSNRDPVIVNQPAPQVVNPVVIQDGQVVE